jgi:hypothetical protein
MVGLFFFLAVKNTKVISDEQNQPSCLKVIFCLLQRCNSNDIVFPPNDFYNEGWLLRIIMDWFTKQDSSTGNNAPEI